MPFPPATIGSAHLRHTPFAGRPYYMNGIEKLLLCWRGLCREISSEAGMALFCRPKNALQRDLEYPVS